MCWAGGFPSRRGGKDTRRVEGRVPGGERQGGADCWRVARSHFQVRSCLAAPFCNIFIGLGVLMDLQGSSALQATPAATSGAAIVVFATLLCNHQPTGALPASTMD